MNRRTVQKIKTHQPSVTTEVATVRAVTVSDVTNTTILLGILLTIILLISLIIG